MKHLFLVTLFSILFISCNKDDSDSDTIAIERESITFIYGSQQYLGEKDENGDLDLSSLNTEIKDLVTSGFSIENTNSKAIHLFKTKSDMSTYLNEFAKSHKSLFSKQQSTINANFYEHSHQNGGFRSAQNNFYIHDLSLYPYTFNDRISSTKITNPTPSFYIVQFYEHSYKRGRVHTVIVFPFTTNNVDNFQTIGFNDITSSIHGFLL